MPGPVQSSAPFLVGALIAQNWREYQETTAAFFRSLGLEARTNAKLTGARTTHDVDVVVKSQHVGFEITWVVECKFWHTSVSKLHVLGLRTIVSDLGADRGILLSETGFQSGAIEAAQLTNVQVTSLRELKGAARKEIMTMRLRELYDRAEACREQYWDIPKQERIERGLRPDVMEDGYSGTHVLDVLKELFLRAFRGEYPISIDSLSVAFVPSVKQPITAPEDLIAAIEPLIVELESKLKT